MATVDGTEGKYIEVKDIPGVILAPYVPRYAHGLTTSAPRQPKAKEKKARGATAQPPPMQQYPVPGPAFLPAPPPPAYPQQGIANPEFLPDPLHHHTQHALGMSQPIVYRNPLEAQPQYMGQETQNPPINLQEVPAPVASGYIPDLGMSQEDFAALFAFVEAPVQGLDYLLAPAPPAPTFSPEQGCEDFDFFAWLDAMPVQGFDNLPTAAFLPACNAATANEAHAATLASGQKRTAETFEEFPAERAAKRQHTEEAVEEPVDLDAANREFFSGLNDPFLGYDPDPATAQVADLEELFGNGQ
jgi:hypothetical protein